MEQVAFELQEHPAQISAMSEHLGAVVRRDDGREARHAGQYSPVGWVRTGFSPAWTFRYRSHTANASTTLGFLRSRRSFKDEPKQG